MHTVYRENFAPVLCSMCDVWMDTSTDWLTLTEKLKHNNKLPSAKCCKVIITACDWIFRTINIWEVICSYIPNPWTWVSNRPQSSNYCKHAIFRVGVIFVFFVLLSSSLKILPNTKIKPICLYEGNRISIIKITPTWNVLPTLSRTFSPANITTFTIYKTYYVNVPNFSYTPRNEVRGGTLESPCPSVCPAAFGFPAHNCFPFTPIIMKLHMQTPHEARMCPIDFEVKRSKVKVTMHKLLKMVSGA